MANQDKQRVVRHPPRPFHARFHATNKLGICLLLSVLIHGLLLSRPGWLAGNPASGTPREILHTRLAASPATATAPAPLSGAPPAPPGSGEASASGPLAPQVSASPALAQAPGLLLGPWYYTAKWLHRRPTPLHPILPQYPPAATQVAGRVQLLLLINEQGGLDSYRVQGASPAGVFEEATITAFTQARYAPGLITNHAVRSQLLVEVIFEPGEAPRVGMPALEVSTP